MKQLLGNYALAFLVLGQLNAEEPLVIERASKNQPADTLVHRRFPIQASFLAPPDLRSNFLSRPSETTTLQGWLTKQDVRFEGKSFAILKKSSSAVCLALPPKEMRKAVPLVAYSMGHPPDLFTTIKILKIPESESEDAKLGQIHYQKQPLFDQKKPVFATSTHAKLWEEISIYDDSYQISFDTRQKGPTTIEYFLTLKLNGQKLHCSTIVEQEAWHIATKLTDSDSNMTWVVLIKNSLSWKE